MLNFSFRGIWTFKILDKISYINILTGQQIMANMQVEAGRGEGAWQGAGTVECKMAKFKVL